MSPARAELADGHPLAGPVRDFLDDLRAAGRSPHTLRGYRSDLAEFTQHHPGDVGQVDVAVLRRYFTAISGRALATQARKQAAVAAFLHWSHRTA